MSQKILKASFILVLAMTLAACTGGKKKTPASSSSNDGDGGETTKRLCEAYPNSDYCKFIAENTLLKLEDAKPIQANNKTKELLYWSDPLYSKGFQYKRNDGPKYIFTVETGSSLKAGDRYTYYLYSASDGSKLEEFDELYGRYVSIVSESEVAVNGGTLGIGAYNEKNFIPLALFPNKTYLLLPPIEVVA